MSLRSVGNLPYNTGCVSTAQIRAQRGKFWPQPQQLPSSASQHQTLHSAQLIYLCVAAAALLQPCLTLCVWLEPLFYVVCQATLCCFQMWKITFIKRCLFIILYFLKSTCLLNIISDIQFLNFCTTCL